MNVYGNKSIIKIHYDNVLQGRWKYRTAAHCTTNTERPGDSTGCVINISAVAGLSPGSVTLIESYVVFLKLRQIEIISGVDNNNKSVNF